MIISRFFLKDNKFAGFEIKGHSGLREAGEDILCAGVSTMTSLVVNTISEIFREPCEFDSDENIPRVSFRIKGLPSDAANGLMKGFFAELLALSKTYPENIKTEKSHS